MYYRVDTQQTFTTHSEIRASFLTGDVLVMFSDIITDEDLAHRGVFPLTSVKPDVAAGQIAVPAEITQVDGVWTQQWAVRDMTADELAAAKPPVPQSVTRRQARQALLLKGLLDKVDPALAAIPDPTQQKLAQIEWEDSLDFERNRGLVVAIGQAIGLDSAGLDELFIYAATL